MHLVRNILVAFILMAIVTTGGVLVYQYKIQKKGASQVAQTSQTPQQNIAEAKEETRSATSLDGSKTLTMKANTEGEAITYSFYANSDTPLLTQTIVGTGTTMDVPDNAWSPGEKYVFLYKTENGVQDSLVFNASGEPFATGQEFLDVGALFKEKEIPYIFKSATGWADPSLLLVQTTKEDGNKGPNYWFELPSGAFIQLAH